MSSEENLKRCPYCLVLLPAPARDAHVAACDRVFWFRVRMLEDVSGSVNGIEYSHRKGDIADLNFDLYRQLRNRCERIMEET